MPENIKTKSCFQVSRLFFHQESSELQQSWPIHAIPPAKDLNLKICTQPPGHSMKSKRGCTLYTKLRSIHHFKGLNKGCVLCTSASYTRKIKVYISIPPPPPAPNWNKITFLHAIKSNNIVPVVVEYSYIYLHHSEGNYLGSMNVLGPNLPD